MDDTGAASQAKSSREGLALDMQALSAFNRALASGALVQLYHDGKRMEALSWADRLDIFESAKIQNGDGEAISHGSLFDAALSACDKEALAAWEMDSARRLAMYRIRMDAVARSAAKHAQSNPDFGRWLIAKLDPLPKTDAIYSHRSSFLDHTALGSLALAACKHKRYEWLGAIDELARKAEGAGIPAWPLIRENFLKEADVEGARALMALGEIPRDALHEMAMRFCMGAQPAEELFWSELMDLRFEALRLQARERSQWSGSAPPDDASLAARAALWGKPWETPAKWLEWHLGKGVDGFVHKADSGLALAIEALAGNWREGLDRWDRDGVSKLARAEQARLRRESELLPLIELMADRAQGGLDAKIATIELPQSIKKAFAGADGGYGARKIDALALCVAQGYFRIADALVAKGADWRFAAKQCAQWLAAVDKDFEGPQDHGMRQAYLEGLALREVSLRASSKKGASQNARTEARCPPPPSRRL